MKTKRFQLLAQKFLRIKKNQGAAAATEFLDEFKGSFAAKIGVAIAVELMFENYEINKKVSYERNN